MKNIQFYTLAFLLCLTNAIGQIVKVDRKYGTKTTVKTVTTAPTWAKAAPVNVNYYYLPDIDTYYDVPARRYIYNSNGKWVRTAVLPSTYSRYNLSTGRTVYLTDYKGNAPYTLYNVHKVKYKGNKHWKRNGHDNGHHRGKGKGKKSD
jgi:hypothetical protein